MDSNKVLILVIQLQLKLAVDDHEEQDISPIGYHEENNNPLKFTGDSSQTRFKC